MSKGSSRSIRPGVALAACLAGFTPVALLAAIAPGSLLTLDRPVTSALVGARRGWLTPLVEAASLLGSRAVLIGLLLGLVVWGAMTRRCSRSVLIAIGVLVAAMVVEWSLKHLIDRPRPEPVLHLDAVSTRAFPSGHATSAAAVYAILAVLFGGGRRWILAGLLIAVIGLSRVYLGVHWLSDVVGGSLLGGAVASAGAIVLRGHRLDPVRCAGGHDPPPTAEPR